MNKAELSTLLAHLDLKPSRKLGQNFLIDSNLLAAIVRTAAPQAGENILEVGPGTGILTSELLHAGARVTAVEYDHRLAEFLRQHYAQQQGLTVIEADCCRLDYAALMPQPFRCVANLPYACSSPLLARFSRMSTPPREILVLLQEEMAERICAVPHTKAYGALSVRLQLIYTTKILRTVPPEVFFPRPAVGSALTRLQLKPVLLDTELCQLAAAIAAQGFSQRRKKFLTLLKKKYGTIAEHAFAELSIPVQARAEELPVAAFVQLATCMKAVEATYCRGTGCEQEQI